MTEIDKLYKNAGIEPDIDYICDIDSCGSQSCDRVKSYPEFTEEKQLEILKLILKKRRILDVGYIIEEDKYHCMHYEHIFDSFKEALCADVNYHWQDLTPEEKQQVKDILNECN